MLINYYVLFIYLYAFRLDSNEIAALLDLNLEEEHEDEGTIPVVGNTNSDVEIEIIIKFEPSDSDDDDDEGEEPIAFALTSKDGTLVQYGKINHFNILRKKSGAANFSKMFTAKETFKSIMDGDIYSIILRETNKKGKQIIDNHYAMLVEKFPNAAKRPENKFFEPFTEEEFDAFLEILIIIGLHKSNLTELWMINAQPIARASMSRDWFVLLIRVIRFDSYSTREACQQLDKATSIS